MKTCRTCNELKPADAGCAYGAEWSRARIDAASLDACRRIEDAQRQGRLIAF